MPAARLEADIYDADTYLEMLLPSPSLLTVHILRVLHRCLSPPGSAPPSQDGPCQSQSLP
jgi:hypothetical protein